MIETLLGVLNSKETSSREQVKGFVLGTNDSSKESNSAARETLLESLQMLVPLAKVCGKTWVDGARANHKDNDGLKHEGVVKAAGKMNED